MAYLDYEGLKKHIELTKAYVNGKLAHYISQEQLSAVAVSGSYNDLTDKPEFSADEDIAEAIAAHNSSENPHSNLFQIVDSGTTPTGLDIGGIYFELDSIETEPDIGFSGLVLNGDSNTLVESESDLIKLTDTYFNYSN
jgi:hypothetical protein